MTQSLDRAHELLRKAAAQFRFYEGQHRAKLDDPLLLPNTERARDTTAKAEANAALAFEIEDYLYPMQTHPERKIGKSPVLGMPYGDGSARNADGTPYTGIAGGSAKEGPSS